MFPLPLTRHSFHSKQHEAKISPALVILEGWTMNWSQSCNFATLCCGADEKEWKQPVSHCPEPKTCLSAPAPACCTKRIVAPHNNRTACSVCCAVAKWGVRCTCTPIMHSYTCIIVVHTLYVLPVYVISADEQRRSRKGVRVQSVQ